MVLFSTCGFLTFYVSTRLYGREFSRAENAGVRAAERLRELQPKTDIKVGQVKAVEGLRELQPKTDIKVQQFKASATGPRTGTP